MRICHVGFVVGGVVGIVAARLYAAEVSLGGIEIAAHEGHVTHSQIVFVLVLRIEALVMHLSQFGLGERRIVLHAIVGAQRELHLVGVRRSMIFGKEAFQTPFDILHLQFGVAKRQIVVDALDAKTVGDGRQGAANVPQFGARLGPMAEVVERNAALDTLVDRGRLRMQRQRTARKQQQSQYKYFPPHKFRFNYTTHKDNHFGENCITIEPKSQ